MHSVSTFARQCWAGLRVLLVLTVIVGVLYPLGVTLIAQLPGLRDRANGSQLQVNGEVVGSRLLGQSYTDKDGNTLPQYFQSRPSAVSYDPTASGASNLGPESIVDKSGSPSLLTQVCTRSLAVGKLDGVDGSRPFCTPGGVGAVLAVFYTGPGYAGAITHVVSVNELCPTTPFITRYRGVQVACAKKGANYTQGRIVAVRGDALAHPAVPADAVTASGSGLDPDISTAYARIQEARVAAARHTTIANIRRLVADYTTQRFLGFVGEPYVNVLQLNVALDTAYPTRA